MSHTVQAADGSVPGTPAILQAAGFVGLTRQLLNQTEDGMDISTMTATELGAAIKDGRTTAVEAVRQTLDAIEKKDKELHAFITVDAEGAMKSAAEVQKKIESGELTGPLAGVPIAIKDNICTKGLLTTCASHILDNFVPTYDAEVIIRLKKNGLVTVGKTNMDEFAMGSTTETSYFGPTRNPVNPAHVPGGSSGGSCAAVGSGEVSLALGSDTGGSIRQPSSYCGVTGMKPTYGVVSRYGLVAYGSSLDQIGPIARNVTDAAALLQVIAGPDSKDSTSAALKDYDFMSALKTDVSGLRIGIPSEYFGEGLEPEIGDAIRSAAEKLAKAGASVKEFHLDLIDYAIPAYYIIACAEASSNLERFDGVKYGLRAAAYDDLNDMYKKSRTEGFGPEVQRRIMLGSFVLSSGYYDAYYLKALRVKNLIRQSFSRAFADFDIILAPAAPTTAPELGKSLADPMKMYLSDIYTVSVNLCGLPGMTVPVGKDGMGLPIGMQIIGDCFSEKTVLRAAYTTERLLSEDGEGR